MRRIIERIVTVVTTTTWKISWREDPIPSDPSPDSVISEFPELEASPKTVQHLQQFPPMIEAKEVDLSVRESTDEKITDEPHKIL